MKLRNKIIHLAYSQPELRQHLLPILKKGLVPPPPPPPLGGRTFRSPTTVTPLPQIVPHRERTIFEPGQVVEVKLAGRRLFQHVVVSVDDPRMQGQIGVAPIDKDGNLTERNSGALLVRWYPPRWLKLIHKQPSPTLLRRLRKYKGRYASRAQMVALKYLQRG